MYQNLNFWLFCLWLKNMYLLPVSDPYFMTSYSIYKDFRYTLWHYSDENETKPINSDNNTISWHIHMYDSWHIHMYDSWHIHMYDSWHIHMYDSWHIHMYDSWHIHMYDSWHIHMYDSWHIHMYDEVQLIDMVFLVDVLVDI